ncbi:MAG: hypothetical protein VYA11_08180 [Planctomycetota bacterium]|nr:hypothetical protein [Planctomycetota bacterium]
MPGIRKVWGLLTLAILLLAARHSPADVLFEFSNDVSGTWHDASNWDQGFVPGGVDHVVTIDRAGADPIITYSASSGTTQIKSLTSSESLVFSGGSLEILETANLSAPLSLSGGMLIGGVITTSSSIEANSSGSNALQGVTLNGAINLTGGSDRVAIYNSLTLNGTADLSGSSSILEFDGGTQTLGADAGQSTTIDIGTTSSTVRVLNGAQLTLEDTVTVEGRGMLRGYGSGNTINSDGLIHANESSGYILIDPENFTNTGTLRISNGSALSLNGNWDNQGTIDLSEGTLNLYDDFTTANINQSTFTRGSSTEVRLWGNLDNTGEVLDAVGDIHLHSSSSSVAGTIIGGTVNVDLHVTSGAYESVDGVTLNGTAHLTGGSDRLRVYNSLTLNGTADLSGSSSILEFDGGTQTLGADAGQNGLVQLGSSSSTLRVLGGGTLTLDERMVVEGRGRIRGYDGGNTVINEGLIHANDAGGSIIIDPENFTNLGTLEVSGGGQLSLYENVTNYGSIEVGSGSTLGTFGLGTGGLNLLTGSVMRGDGIISGDLTNSAGTVEPNGLSISSNYVQMASGTIHITAGGPAQGTEYDFLDISGSASLSGVLQLELRDGFVPEIDDTFTILEADGGVTGTFDEVVGLGGSAWSVNYLSTSVVVAFQGMSVPEPGSAILSLVSLMIFLGFQSNRRGRIF